MTRARCGRQTCALSPSSALWRTSGRECPMGGQCAPSSKVLEGVWARGGCWESLRHLFSPACVLSLPGAGCTATSSSPASSHLAATTPSSRCDTSSAAVPPQSPLQHPALWGPTGCRWDRQAARAIGWKGKPGWVLAAPQAGSGQVLGALDHPLAHP